MESHGVKWDNIEDQKAQKNNGGEYQDTIFKKFCYKREITMERTMPWTPQHNGVAECISRRLTERVTNLHVQSGLPKQFWIETVISSTYLIIWGPSAP